MAALLPSVFLSASHIPVANMNHPRFAKMVQVISDNLNHLGESKREGKRRGT
jgi:hypothetical protein